MQPDSPDEKEKTKRKNDAGITTSYGEKIFVFLLLPPFLVVAIILFIGACRIIFDNLPVVRFLLTHAELVPMGLWSAFSLFWIVLWRKLFRRTKDGILLFIVHSLFFIAVAAVIIFFSFMSSLTLRASVVINTVEYALTSSFGGDIMLWGCSENLCYGQVIMNLDSGPYTAILSIIDNNIMLINTEYVGFCLPLQNLQEKIMARDVVLKRDCSPIS